MALHDQLPIHKSAYDLLGVVMELVRNMPREIKHAFGGELRDECLAILVAIYRANCARDKVPHLEKLLEHVQVVILLLRLARDKYWIATKAFAATMPYTVSIGKQATAWRNKYASPDSRGPRLP